MFDRLGRRDDETPFVVEWFAKNGIQVWSAMEGQQRFDSHVDKLMNYIRYWQASGESLKTSARTKTRLAQLTQEGHYTGGFVPFGYRTVDKGRRNKKNQTVLDLEIDEEEAEIVRLIFRKYVLEGYGTQRISRFLHEQGITHKDGRNFPNTSLLTMLKNEINIGILKNGESRSDCLEELRIIDEDTFARAQEIRKERRRPESDVPMNSRGKSLLVGNIYCAHCGHRLTMTTSGKRVVKEDGTVKYVSIIRYQCHYKVRHPGECDGQSGYNTRKLDGIVDRAIRTLFAQIGAAAETDLLTDQHKKEIQAAQEKLEQARIRLAEKEAELSDYKEETIRVIRGQSTMSVELFNALVAETQAAIRELQSQIDEAEREHASLLQSSARIRKEYDRLISWAELYDKCSFEAKKMIVSQLIKVVRVGESITLRSNLMYALTLFGTAVSGKEKRKASNPCKRQKNFVLSNECESLMDEHRGVDLRFGTGPGRGSDVPQARHSAPLPFDSPYTEIKRPGKNAKPFDLARNP